MTDIRPFERADVEGVLALLEARLPWWTHDESFLEQTLIDSPWADPELPSLVAVDDEGGILGFIGSQARRLKLDDRELRGICCAHLAVSSDPRAGPAGALLLRRLLSGRPGPHLDRQPHGGRGPNVAGVRRPSGPSTLLRLDAGPAAVSVGPRRARREDRATSRAGGRARWPRFRLRPRGAASSRGRSRTSRRR